LPWKYKESDYEKMLDPDGMTTEFGRCPDPTDAGVVANITGKTLTTPKDVGWS
jgi:hypothetical protein